MTRSNLDGDFLGDLSDNFASLAVKALDCERRRTALDRNTLREPPCPLWLRVLCYRCQNFPIPSLTCTVLIPRFGVANPAFEMCK